MDPGPLGALARRSTVPVAATTVNIFESTATDALGPATTTAEVRQFVAEVGVGVAYYVEGGICPLAQHLTVVDGSGKGHAVVQPGVVH
jgi:L-threonylcarbamoyladenylate synthase